MVIGKNIVPFITEFVDALDNAISQHDSSNKLSNTQKYWLAFCLMGILRPNRFVGQNLNVSALVNIAQPHSPGYFIMLQFLGKYYSGVALLLFLPIMV